MEPNCSQCYSPDPSDNCLTEIKVDADVAGIGILVAFILAAVITCITIVFAYLGDSLPGSLLSSTDEAAIHRCRKFFISRRLVPKIGRFWRSFESLLYYCVRRDLPQSRPALAREQRIEAVTRFLLGFSDQQLITGLAILIAALANRNELTLYELKIVYSLAWFSATTHIATLKVLREYFYDHAVVRNWRVLGICTFIVLMCFVHVILFLAGESEYGGVNYGRPIQCIINGDSRRETPEVLNAFSDVYSFLFLLFLYIFPTRALYYDPREIPQPDPATRFLMSKKKPVKHLSRTLPRKSLRILYQNEELQHIIVTESRVSATSPRLFSLRFSRYQDSFLSYIPIMVFSITFGISQVVVVTWIDNPETTDDVRRMGFGQVVAIALLAIPMLTGAEIYNEATNATATQHEPQIKHDVNDMKSFQQLDPELSRLEYEERERCLGIDKPP
ncbi:hypothetical protein P280DRAFT_551295 [Massarina eburnea CBS 473.64]|uniref:Uncharacterized protein n=1 Tax=Massarina eburnea CBS 473.64 TaxID=1395130 RepID=A0A6A6RVE9_9PLEO|nr:hypothetical protein P280DRAFT_551295 [Massarina eburnea CBS 473.64]